MKLLEMIKRISGFLALILTLLLFWSCAYWVTSWLFDRIHYVPADYVRQLINSLLGFFLFGFCMAIVANIKWVKSRQEQFLHPILQAMKMMAEGNFNIDLSYYRNQHQGRGHPYSRIVESIRDMAGKLSAMEEMRQEFISNVSHEIQSPLTSISGFAHALKNEELGPDERKHYLEIIEMESSRLSKLSENLLKLTSLESDKFLFDQQNYRLDRQLRRSILAIEPQWAEKQIHMDIALEELTVTANKDLMEQVWMNLLHNSIKFTPREGTIRVEALKASDNLLIIKIQDTGIGMDKEALMHIFERFYKADPSRNRNFGGSGLGLSIVKKIIDLHNGLIQVQSEPGEGTEVTITLRQTID